MVLLFPMYFPSVTVTYCLLVFRHCQVLWGSAVVRCCLARRKKQLVTSMKANWQTDRQRRHVLCYNYLCRICLLITAVVVLFVFQLKRRLRPKHSDGLNCNVGPKCAVITSLEQWKPSFTQVVNRWVDAGFLSFTWFKRAKLYSRLGL